MRDEFQSLLTVVFGKENILKVEGARLENNIQEAHVKSDLRKVEIMTMNESIAAKKKFKRPLLKHLSFLLKPKKELAEKDKEFGVLLNNLNDMNKQSTQKSGNYFQRCDTKI